MNYGAVIVAAGMSSRMGDFKPMLSIGSMSIAQRVIATFQQAGVDRIVVVTGYNADALEHHLSRSGVVFIRNENYETTEMFDSAKLGLAYMRGKCGRVFFTPVDIPLFTAGTVRLLMKSDALLACPSLRGERGHPLLMKSSVIDRILEDSGEGGLKGALSRCGIEPELIESDDPGILHDADTPEDYRLLLKYHNEQLARPEVEIRLSKEKTFFDRRTAMLLTLINETHSVRMACRRMQLSYSSGWSTIKSIEEELGYSVVERSQGGARGGSSTLTPAGRKLLDLYMLFERDVKAAAESLYEKYFSEIL